jgi:hypothetical protein
MMQSNDGGLAPQSNASLLLIAHCGTLWSPTRLPLMDQSGSVGPAHPLVGSPVS